jgi:hypothetical protein
MATTYVVCLHKGAGVIGGSFSTLALATAFVGSKPNCGYEIQAVVTDAAVGQVIAQQGIGQFVSTGPGLTNVGG